ncbi:MAG: Hsp20/alpha crystallin family protein [Clostridiales bacterium]|jgi:HSP20 family protein|nr:Hsp20/alpha crystallin family protein [Clostridiales bacterium]
MFGLTPYRKNRDMARRGVWSPWADFDRAMEAVFSGWRFPDLRGGIKIDVKETDKEYIVDAELPGFDKEDIKLELDDNMLTIQAQRDENEKEERDNYIRKEIRRCCASRRFYVENVKKEDIKANYENGILHIVLPKDEQEIEKRKIIDIE